MDVGFTEIGVASGLGCGAGRLAGCSGGPAFLAVVFRFGFLLRGRFGIFFLAGAKHQECNDRDYGRETS